MYSNGPSTDNMVYFTLEVLSIPKFLTMSITNCYSIESPFFSKIIEVKEIQIIIIKLIICNVDSFYLSYGDNVIPFVI